jgi:hypothetical protein
VTSSIFLIGIVAWFVASVDSSLDESPLSQTETKDLIKQNTTWNKLSSDDKNHLKTSRILFPDFTYSEGLDLVRQGMFSEVKKDSGLDVAEVGYLLDNLVINSWYEDYSKMNEEKFCDDYRIYSVENSINRSSLSELAGGGLTIDAAVNFGKIDAIMLISPWIEPIADSGTIISNERNDIYIHEFLETNFTSHIQNGDRFDHRVNLKKAVLSRHL